MIWQRYWRNLQRAHRQAISTAAGPGRLDRNLNLVAAVACALGILLLLATGGYRAGFDAVHGMNRYVPAVVLQVLSILGETAPAACLVALIVRRKPRVAWMGALAATLATLITHALKGMCETARPAAVLGDWVTATGPTLRLHSFPSGHTMTAFLVAACFAVGATRGARMLLYAMAAAVGLSRIWVGAHWPVDVIAGAGIAGLSVGLAIPLASTKWGTGLLPNLLVASLIAMCAAWQLTNLPESPLPRALGVVLAALAASVIARDYLVRPLLPDDPGRG